MQQAYLLYGVGVRTIIMLVLQRKLAMDCVGCIIRECDRDKDVIIRSMEDVKGDVTLVFATAVLGIWHFILLC